MASRRVVRQKFFDDTSRRLDVRVFGNIKIDRASIPEFAEIIVVRMCVGEERGEEGCEKRNETKQNKMNNNRPAVQRVR